MPSQELDGSGEYRPKAAGLTTILQPTACTKANQPERNFPRFIVWGVQNEPQRTNLNASTRIYGSEGQEFESL
jgi:hypothetical protein